MKTWLSNIISITLLILSFSVEGKEKQEAVPLNHLKLWKTIDAEFLPPFSFDAYTVTSENFISEKTMDSLFYYWAAINIYNEDTFPKKIYLIADNPMVGEVALYQMQGDSAHHIFTTGDNYTFQTRPLLRRNFVFPISLSPLEESTFYIRVFNEGRRVYIPFYTMLPDNYEVKEQKLMIYSVVHYGIMLTIAIVAMIMFFFLRANSLLILSGVVFFICMVTVMASGIGYMVLVPENPKFYNRLQHASIYFALTFVLLYTYSYLKPLMAGQKRLMTAYRMQIWVLLAVGLLVFFSNLLQNFFAPILYISSIWVMGLSLLTGFYTIAKNIKEAGYYLIALVLGFFASTLYYINIFQPVTYDNVITGPIHLGSTSAFLFILLMAEMERVRVLRKNQEAALKELAVLYEERKKAAATLEKEVLITQRELEKEKKVAGLAVMKGEEKERQRIAQELHDGIGSLLTVLRLQLGMLSSEKDDENALFRQTIENSNRLLDTAYEELKGITERVLPTVLQHFGLKKALEDLTKQINTSNKLKLSIETKLTSEVIPSNIENAIYRIVLEIVTNILKHAGATKASVMVAEEEGIIYISGQDNGKGLDVHQQSGGSGLNNMRNRAVSLGGKFDIKTKENQGTTIFITIPLSYDE